MNKFAATALALAGLTGAVPTAFTATSNPPTAATATNPSTSTHAAPTAVVSATQILQVTWRQTLAANGEIAAWQEASVSARSGGLAVVALLADVGARVQRGQVLARLDDRTVRAELAQAEATVAQSEANQRQALSNRERTMALQHSGAVSDQDILQAVTQADSAAAQWAQAQANLQAARVRLENTVVSAPDAGIVLSRAAVLGQVPNNGMELFKLLRQGRLEWRAQVVPDALGGIQPGMAAQVRLPDGDSVRGQVRQVAPVLDAATRLATVHVDLQGDARLKPSMYLKGELDLGAATATVVPAESLVIKDGRPQLFVVHGERVQRVPVQTGRRQVDWVEITQGAQPGQTVAVRGAGFLSGGERVQIQAHAVLAPPSTAADASRTKPATRIAQP